MNTSTKLAFALAILMGVGSLPAKAMQRECTAWTPVLGTACKTRLCPIGVPPADRFKRETVCQGGSIPQRPILEPSHVLSGSRGTTAPQ
jgi:hypothetical protein